MNPFNSSNGWQLESQSSTAECSNRELGVLKNIEQMLMEEGNMDEQTHMLAESLDFQAKERSFYELLDAQNQPPSSADDNYHNSTSSGSRHVIDDANKNLFLSGSSIDEEGIEGSHLVEAMGKKNKIFDFGEEERSKKLPAFYPESNNVPIQEFDDEQTRMLQECLGFQAKERSFYELLVGPKHPPPSANHNITCVVDRFSYPPHMNDKHSESQVFFNFQKGVIEEGNIEEVRGKKNKTADFGEEEERSKKLPAIYPESTNVPIEEFDNALICTIGELEKKFKACTLQAKGRRRHNNHNETEMIDFRSLLLSCAQSIAADDHRTSDGLLKQIRKHSSPLGDGEQRFAHYFANALEARLACTGGQMQKSLLVKRTTASDYLRAYYTYISSSPFVRISNFVSSKMIFDNPGKENKVRIHIIDFGILYGFQWPTCFMHLSKQEGGPPKIKITGIDFPETGFRPAERVEETGRRLARYAKMFNVPFEFNAIAQNWESIKIEDLKLEKGEFVAVNCLYQAENLLDEAGVGESPRTMVLNLIRKIKPDYFIHGVVSAAYASPFFVSRFREASFHYSAIYDMLEATIPREKPERAMLERDVFGKEALHVLACEDRERLGRTETYKQWRLRHLRAGFVQIPFGRETMGTARYLVRNLYHRDFLIQDDNDWLLMGWKGRILYAISCWRPVSENASLR